LGGRRPLRALAARGRRKRLHPHEPAGDDAGGGLAQRGRRRRGGLLRADERGRPQRRGPLRAKYSLDSLRHSSTIAPRPISQTSTENARLTETVARTRLSSETIRLTALSAAPAYMSRTAVRTGRGGAGRVGSGGISPPCG